MTNRILGLPIFAAIMTLVYYIAISTVGTALTDWTNDVFVGEWILSGRRRACLEGIGCADWLHRPDCGRHHRRRRRGSRLRAADARAVP